MKRINFLFFLVLFLAYALTSCHTREKLVYFQNNGIDSAKVATYNYTPVLKIDDLLHISISCDVPELAIPFNLSQAAVGAENSGNTSGFLINNAGMISLPILGEVKVAGLNRMAACELIQNKLKSYLTNPIVQINILNYKITVLGDVKNPGTFKIANERLTILEAIGMAGDMNITGVRKNVLVIREENNTRKEYRIDFTKKDVLSSEVYYLQQNDVVYVEPNVTARSNSSFIRAVGTSIISATSLIVSTLILITRQ